MIIKRSKWRFVGGTNLFSGREVLLFLSKFCARKTVITAIELCMYMKLFINIRSSFFFFGKKQISQASVKTKIL